MDGSGNRLHSPDWQTIREHEISFGIRGIKENSYVASNGSVQESAQGEGLDIWAPALAGLDIRTGLITPGTTLLSVYNNDNTIVPGSNVYGDVVLNRPMFIDEIGIRLIIGADSNCRDYQLSVNLLWLNQGEDWASGTCADYSMNNLNVAEGYGGGALVTLYVPDDTFAVSTISVGATITGLTSGAVMTVVSWTNDSVTGTVVGTFQSEPATTSFEPSTIAIISFTDYPATNRLMWSPDRLYNAGVGPTEQPGIVPVGHGPNAFVAYADADAEAVTPACVRPLNPISLTDTGRSDGVYIPPKDSFIIDPGQSIAIQALQLYVPPAGFQGDGTPINATGTYSIAAWIRFRQPLDYEPYDWDKVSVADKW